MTREDSGHVIRVGPDSDVSNLLKECQANPGTKEVSGILEIREDQRPGREHEEWLYLKVGAEDFGYIVQWVPAPPTVTVPSSPEVDVAFATMAAKFNRMAVAFRLMPEPDVTEGRLNNVMMANFYEIVARMMVDRGPGDETIAAMMERGVRA